MIDSVRPDYAELKFFHSSRVFYVLAVACGIALSYCLVRLVEILFAGDEGLAPLTRALVLLPLVVCCSSFAIFRVSRLDFQKAALVISPEGIWMPATMPQSLPWMSVSQIILFGEYGRPKQIAVILRDNLANEASSQTAKAGPPRSGTRDLVIASALLRNIGTDDLLALMKRYHKKFGPMQDEGPDASDRPTFDSSAWTGIEE
jgi:hypothetical protein